MNLKIFNKGAENENNVLKEKMTKEDYQLICENMKFRFYTASETIMNYGDFGNEFFIILKGTVSVLVPKVIKSKNNFTKL
jgi:signal-transduction protein with cAMP-binding, CBS, and nucleotidyltransferase domain